MAEPVKDRSQITAAWLTETLRRGRHLERGEVSEISMQTFQSFFADFYRLEIKYSPEAAPALPGRMILKVPFAESEAALSMGREEVAAYRKLQALMPDPPIAQCFDSVSDDETGRSHLLLEDLSPTHFRADGDNEASPRQWQTCVEALARLHVFWWEHDGLGVEVGQLFDETDIEYLAKLNAESLDKFFAELGEEISPEMRKTYEATLAFYPDFWRRRLTSRTRNTLIHGDAHSQNFLLPKEAENGRAFMIDLATLRVRPATNDLAYLMALKWRPERRARLELPLLRHYHAALAGGGVKDYSWEDCLLDYRYSVVTHLFTPVVQCAGKLISAGIWRANFARITSAFKDLHCAELVSGE